MARTTPALVEDILAGNWDGATDLQQFIDGATLIVSQVAACATRKGITLDAVTLEMLERLLAADGYTDSDPMYKARATDRASGQFAGRDGEQGPYLRRALMMDPSGCLNAVLTKSRARMVWLGKPRSSMRTYDQRNSGSAGGA